MLDVLNHSIIPTGTSYMIAIPQPGSQALWQLAQVRLELRWEEEALASGETLPESHLLGMVEELVFDIDNGGPIMMCSYEDVESGLIEL